MNFNSIGAGRLGKNVALALSAAHIASLNAICNGSFESAQHSCKALGFGSPVETVAQLPSADLIWITCSDDAISSVVQQLMSCPSLKPESFVVHCSGVLSSSVLAPLKDRGCFIASIHPLKAFRSGFMEADAFANVDCVLEGDEQACTWINTAFTQLGARISTINPQSKAKYHAAASMAANYMHTLAACSTELLCDAGLSKPQAQSIIGALMQGTINNIIETQDCSKSLTGPLMRGDIETLSLHLQAIEDRSIKNLYKAAGLATLPLTHLSDEKRLLIHALFEG